MDNNQNKIESSVISKDNSANKNVESFFDSAKEINDKENFNDNTEDVTTIAIEEILEYSNIIHPDNPEKEFVADSNNKIDNTTEYYYQGRTIKSNPFTEEFNPNDIINRGNSSDFLIEDELKIKQEQEKQNRTELVYIPKSELSALLADNPMVQFYKKDDIGSIVQLNSSNTLADDLYGIKDDEMIEISIPVGHKISSVVSNTEWEEGNQDDDDEAFYISPQDEENHETYYQPDENDIIELRKKEKEQTTLRGIKNVIDDFVKENKYINPDDLFNDFLQENFKDFIQAKKIAGNRKVKYTDKVIPEDLIEDKGEQIEIADISLDFKENKKTSVLINRNKNYDVTSIEVYCKCGEKTIIKFAEADADEFTSENINHLAEHSEDTDIIVDKVRIAPLNYTTEEIKAEQEFENELLKEDIEELEKPIAEED